MNRIKHGFGGLSLRPTMVAVGLTVLTSAAIASTNGLNNPPEVVTTLGCNETVVVKVGETLNFDVIATDHAPHTVEEKSRPYPGAPAGLPLVQHALVALMEHVRTGVFSIEKVVEKTAHAPARLFGVRERGFIREGYHADLVVIDPSQPTPEHPIYSKCGWSPFAGINLSSSVRATWVNGRLRYRDGELLPGPAGMALLYDR